MCTIGVAFTEDATYIFKNRDLTEKQLMSEPEMRLGKHNYIAFPRPTKGIWFGINEHAIALTASDAHTKKTYPEQENAGDIITSIYENIIANSANLKEAEKIMVESFRRLINVPDMLIIADTKTAIAYEYTPEKQALEKKTTGTILRANSFLILSDAPEKKDDPSSHLRYERESELLKEEITLHWIKKTLSDHKNGPGENSICRHGKEKGEYTTQYSVIAEVKKDIIHIYYTANNHPCRSAYKRIELKRR